MVKCKNDNIRFNLYSDVSAKSKNKPTPLPNIAITNFILRPATNIITNVTNIIVPAVDIFGWSIIKLSQQKWFYIPEPQNDFIFAIIGEAEKYPWYY